MLSENFSIFEKMFEEMVQDILNPELNRNFQGSSSSLGINNLVKVSKQVDAQSTSLPLFAANSVLKDVYQDETMSFTFKIGKRVNIAFEGKENKGNSIIRDKVERPMYKKKRDRRHLKVAKNDMLIT